MITWNGEAAILELERRLAFRMNQIAVLAVKQLRKELDRAYPPASKPGQFPRRRTGRLRDSVMWEPVRGSRRSYGVAIRYDAEGFYGNILTARGRRGPADVLRQVAQDYLRS